MGEWGLGKCVCACVCVGGGELLMLPARSTISDLQYWDDPKPEFSKENNMLKLKYRQNYTHIYILTQKQDKNVEVYNKIQ